MFMKKVKMRNHIKKWIYTRVGRLTIVFGIIALISVSLIEYFKGDIIAQIYVSFFYFSGASTFFGFLIIEIFRKRLAAWLNKFKKTPKIFEFGFFVFLFVATYFVTFAAAYLGNPQKLFSFIQSHWLWVSAFGFAFVCGFYHFVERLDEP